MFGFLSVVPKRSERESDKKMIHISCASTKTFDVIHEWAKFQWSTHFLIESYLLICSFCHGKEGEQMNFWKGFRYGNANAMWLENGYAGNRSVNKSIRNMIASRMDAYKHSLLSCIVLATIECLSLSVHSIHTYWKSHAVQ